MAVSMQDDHNNVAMLVTLQVMVFRFCSRSYCWFTNNFRGTPGWEWRC